MKFKMIRNHTQRICTAILLILGIVQIFLACPQIVRAAVLIVLDGEFNDWAGQACFSDPAGDAASPQTDLLSYCFATNPNDPIAYFMVERKPSNKSVEIWLRVDVNNDGSYQSSQDRAIRIQYKPQGNHDSTTIDLLTGQINFSRIYLMWVGVKAIKMAAQKLKLGSCLPTWASLSANRYACSFSPCREMSPRTTPSRCSGAQPMVLAYPFWPDYWHPPRSG